MNELAYFDVIEQIGPRYPENEEYMRKFRFWRAIANLPEDQLLD